MVTFLLTLPTHTHTCVNIMVNIYIMVTPMNSCFQYSVSLSYKFMPCIFYDYIYNYIVTAAVLFQIIEVSTVIW